MLEVFLHETRVGLLEARGRGLRFTYSAEALDEPRLPALSVSLPKRAEPFPDSQAGPFFRNLLPEQAYRRLVAAAAGQAPENSLAMLGAIGGECPGAVSIWPRGERPVGAAVQEYRDLTARDLLALVTASDRAPLGSAVARGRLSLPGVQEKIALFRGDDGRWRLPLGGAITSHILKRADPAFPGLLENELFTLALAAGSGLEVVRSGFAEPAVRVLSVERFDRVRTAASAAASGAGSLVKLHQEDFCQVLRTDPERKYQFDGGPGIRKCAEAIRAYSAFPAGDLERLVRWVCFNYLAGNEDAHAKNLALLYRAGADGLRLSPHYDLVSTEVYVGLKRRLAMKIGAATDVRNVQRRDWERLAREVAIDARQVRAWLLDQAAAVRAALPSCRARCAKVFGESPIYDEIGRICERQAARLERELVQAK